MSTSFWDQLQKAVSPKNQHPPPLLLSATPPLTHTMTSLPHPAHTRQQLVIFSPKMHYADLPYKDACLYQPLLVPPFLPCFSFLYLFCFPSLHLSFH